MLYDLNAVAQCTNLYLQFEAWSSSLPCGLTAWLQQRRNHTQGAQRVLMALLWNSGTSHGLDRHKAQGYCTSLAWWADSGERDKGQQQEQHRRDSSDTACWRSCCKWSKKQYSFNLVSQTNTSQTPAVPLVLNVLTERCPCYRKGWGTWLL